MNPKISIITITRNRAGFITKALESASNQSLTAWELLVLDDDSNDGTEAVVRAIMTTENRVKYYKNHQILGISANRNKGTALAEGRYIAILDSDDFWLDEDKLQKQYDFLEQNPEYALIGSNIKIVDDKGDPVRETSYAIEDGDIRKRIMIENQIPHSSALIRKDFMEKAGGYDEKLSCVEDLDLFLRLGKLGKLKNLAEITTAYTKHSGGTSYQRRLTMAWNHYKIVWKNFGKYPNWLIAIIWAKLRLLKSLI